MEWKLLKNNIYDWDGSWRDIFIPNTSIEDWARWVSYVNANYKVSWHNPATQKVETQIDFSVINEFWSGNDDFRSTANIYIGKIQINSHFFEFQDFENDIDPREFTLLEDHKLLVQYMQNVSELLKKRIYLTQENSHSTVCFSLLPNSSDIIYHE